jgi:hypothetical protein
MGKWENSTKLNPSIYSNNSKAWTWSKQQKYLETLSEFLSDFWSAKFANQ